MLVMSLPAAIQVAEVLFEQVFYHYRTLKDIVTDCDPQFPFEIVESLNGKDGYGSYSYLRLPSPVHLTDRKDLEKFRCYCQNGQTEWQIHHHNSSASKALF